MSKLKQHLNAVLFILLAGVLFVGCGKEEEEKMMTTRDIYLYQAPDRDQKLVERAKKEGKVVMYASMELKDLTPITQAFEGKYGIKVEPWRAFPDKVVQRALIEAKAGRHDVDVLELNGPKMEIFYRENLLEEFYSPALKNIPPEAIPKHKHYVPARFTFIVMAYNTKLVKPEDVPNSYEDLLKPKWRGKIAIESSDVDWFAAVVKEMGEEKGLDYFKKLAKMQPVIKSGHTVITEMAASGEVPISLNVYNHLAEGLKKKGETIEWKALQPAFGAAGGIGLTKDAPHPYAALLFADFILSEGQQILKDRGRVPASLAVDSELNKFQYKLIDPVIVLDEWDKWSKLWADLFLGGKVTQKEQ